MKKLVFIISVMLLSFSAYAVDVTKLNPDSSKECAVCHYEWMPVFMYDLKGTDIVQYQKEKVVAAERMCYSCHNGTVGDSRVRVWAGDMHKIAEKIPEHMNIPVNLPLENGKVGCRTCHSAHATGDPKQEGMERSVFLRMDNNNSELCQACHKDMQTIGLMTHPLVKPSHDIDMVSANVKNMGGKLGTQGQVVCESCHVPHSPKERKLLVKPLQDSAICSSCHNDKVNPNSLEYVKGLLNHPINIRHEDQKEVLETIHAGGIYGKDNEVICLTCHSPHKGKTKSLLIEKNDKSSLCLSCHANKDTVIKTKHDMMTIDGFRTKDGKTAAEKGTCESCHAPHGWAVKLPAHGEDMVSKGCLSCHEEGRIAAKKVISDKLFNHPVGKSLKKDMKQSEKLPLFSKILRFLTEVKKGDETSAIVTCATCHDVHGKAENFLRAEAKTGALCITCHDEKQMVNKTVHGNDKLDKSCLSCHKVHNSENKRLLTKPDNDGCLDCHKPGGSAEKSLIGEHSHPVGMQVTRTLNEHFKLAEGGMFTCVSCHDPHASSKNEFVKKDFLRGGYADGDAFCSACHETQKDVKGSDHDIRKAETDQVCAQCHSVHNAKAKQNIMTLEYAYKDKDDSCKVCHMEKGLADKKIVMDGHKLGKTEMHEKYGKYLTEKDGDYYIYCSSCHTVHNNGPKKGDEGDIRNSFLNTKLTEKNGNFCAGCHEDKKTFAESKHNMMKFEKSTPDTDAKKASGDTCGSCHIVHNSGAHLFAKSFVGNFEMMCSSCHAEGKVADKTKITTSHTMNIKMKKDIKVYLQDGNVVCATCHQPHAVEKGMLRELGGENICLVCHEEQKMVELSEHNMARLDYISAEVRQQAANPCYACHKPHNFHKDNKLMWAYEPQGKEPFAFEMCSSCHKKDGLGYKKIPEAVNHDRIFKIFPYKEQFKEYLYTDAGEISADGSITCASCHEPHIWKKGQTAAEVNVEGDNTNSFLKLEVKDKFCAACHGAKDGNDLFVKYHDREFRNGRNKKLGEQEVMKNILMIQMNLQKYQVK